MAKPDGTIIETPITANFREGLNVLQYFISTHGARKGLADTAIKNRELRLLNPRFVDVSQDVVIRKRIAAPPTAFGSARCTKAKTKLMKLADRLVGRYACEDIVNPTNPKEFLIRSNEDD